MPFFLKRLWKLKMWSFFVIRVHNFSARQSFYSSGRTMCIEPIPRILATIWCSCCHHYHVFYDGKQKCWSKWTNSSMWFIIWFIYVDVFYIWTSLISCLIFFNLFVVAYFLGVLILRFKMMNVLKPFLDFESSF